ncbi:MAG TPA: di-trans,poly-cis-decaprenylcistransferase [Longimicrobiaceae bacterium]|nr:di-trans,poly-cis-decaprenylcistransferase [Longimicrobiaceae bacterium]
MSADYSNGLHVALIMDGNGRWARARGRSRVMGHRAGARAAQRTVQAAREARVRILTLYAFSSDNWARPPREVAGLMRLFRVYLFAETGRCVENGIRLSVIGRRDRLPSALIGAIESAEAATAGGRMMDLRIALDYSARDAIMQTAAETAGKDLSREEFDVQMAKAIHSPTTGEVDLLIRTGGEQRLSDFLLWESAYAELVFSPCMWPDFGAPELASALKEFHSRERRFGGVPEAVAS